MLETKHKEFGNRKLHGKRKKIKNQHEDLDIAIHIKTSVDSLKNRTFSEVTDYVIANSEDGASNLVTSHLSALFQIVPTKTVSETNPLLCSLTINTTQGYNVETFDTDVNNAVAFGYTVVELDSPVKSWKIYYMSIGNNIYCISYSSTFRKITVSSRV